MSKDDSFPALRAAGSIRQHLPRGLVPRASSVVVQFESVTDDPARNRELFMAENAEWIAEKEHPSEKIMLWAHNFHVASAAGWMGGYLRRHWAARYLSVGFLFDSGDFNAVTQGGGGVRVHHASSSHAADAFEKPFRATGLPRLIVDLRDPPPAVASELARPHSMWNIGAVFPTPRVTRTASRIQSPPRAGT